MTVYQQQSLFSVECYTRILIENRPLWAAAFSKHYPAIRLGGLVRPRNSLELPVGRTGYESCSLPLRFCLLVDITAAAPYAS
jgi:hypothetical protein